MEHVDDITTKQRLDNLRALEAQQEAALATTRAQIAKVERQYLDELAEQSRAEQDRRREAAQAAKMAAGDRMAEIRERSQRAREGRGTQGWGNPAQAAMEVVGMAAAGPLAVAR